METVIHEKATRAFAKSPREVQRKLLAWGRRLENDPFMGDHLARARIPASFPRCENLWRLALPNGWRALYTVVGWERTSQCVILWIGDHKQYDRLFGYSTS